MLDLVIVIVAYAALVFLVWLVIALISFAMAFLGIRDVAEILIALGLPIIPICGFLAYWFYGAYFETYYNGRTFGKMAANLRVISTDGHAIDGTQATLRNFFRGVDLMPMVPVAGLIESNELPPQFLLPTAVFGLIVMSLSPKFQRLGDLVAGTMVVNEDGNRDPHVQTFLDTRVPQLAEIIPSSFYVSNSLAKAIAVYVERRQQLGIARAGEIAAKLAGTLIDRFNLPADTDPDLLICSLYYKTFVGQANLDKDSEPGSKYSEVSSPTAGASPAIDLSPYERPVSVGEEPTDVDTPPSVAAEPTVPTATQTKPPTNPELE